MVTGQRSKVTVATISSRTGTTASYASGTGKYDNEVVSRLQKTHEVRRIEYDMLLLNARGGVFNILFHLMYKAWFTIIAPIRARRSEVIHVLSQMYAHLIPLLPKKKTVITVHDIIPLKYSDATNILFRWFELLNIWGVKRARHIITDSIYSKDELVRELHIKPERIHIIYPGVSEKYHVHMPEDIQGIREYYQLPERFVLYVGSDRPRKNLPTLIDAFAAARKQLSDLQLVLVGSSEHGPTRAEMERRIRHNGIQEFVHQRRDVPEVDLPYFYNAARCFAFPSEREGFGWPPLEAMACGCPVVTTAETSIGEIVGDAAEIVPARDAAALADALVRICGDEAYYGILKNKGLEHVKRFSWDEAMQKMEEYYEKLVVSS